MSRRKQEKPQPRKNLIPGDLDSMPDLLTCGACQKDFPLAEIVRFIQHKVQRCNKENSLLLEPEDSEDRPPPPLLLKKEDPGEEPVSSSSIVKVAAALAHTAKDALADCKREPRIYVCSTCKQSLSTAWALIQHVQGSHGLRICADSAALDADPPPEQPSLGLFGLRAPLLERQPEPLFRSSHQELRLDLLGKSSTPPPLLEPPSKLASADDFYSQRLRVLAGATSPGNSNPATTPQKLLPASFKVMLNHGSSKTSPRPSPPPLLDSSPSSEAIRLNHSSASSTTSEHQAGATTPSKNRLCEYCGKSFQFKSNLIVHRRSHTGEKPFKCHVCDHACTQASKLKRHMKTHRKLANGKFAQRLAETNGDETAPKTNGEKREEGEGEEKATDDEERPQTNGVSEGGESEEEDEPEEGEEEDEVNVDGVDENGVGEGELVIDHDGEEDMDEGEPVAEDLTKKPRNGLENGEKRLAKYSVIHEIMEKNGFGCIPPYNEAYKQALRESGSLRRGQPQERGASSDGSASNDGLSHHSFDAFGSHPPERPPRDGTRSAGQSPLGFGIEPFDHPSGLTMKRLRLEDHGGGSNYLYAGVWFPRVEHQSQFRDLYGVEATQNHKVSQSSPPTAARGPGTSRGSAGKEQPQGGARRNDTCEYCGKVFKNCSNLTVHRRSHTGEKPYKCELCSYACAQSSKLTRHMKTHGRLGKDVYRCRFCDMPFSVASTLEKHMRKCVVSQGGGSPYLVSSEPDDSKEMTAA